MTRLAIEKIERAINIWRARFPAPEGPNECPTLCPEARALADVYAVMIVERKLEIAVSMLTAVQLAALQGALNLPNS
ncbi:MULTISPECIES: DUF3717 domain-containing protein [Burkholderia]|uniref:DUF3717 domain-containing protein n=2 Tax=Burkholderia TaxID=32008 RepID=A0A0C5B292_BURPE|nr:MULTISPECIES: DUF3717 domain-containing protein [Burkholderia]AJL34915.1 hypothetical protein pBPS032 [Burkholderia pseudomallei]MDD1493971.1 DUF3717 domain-containing protein [Burkholderia thailandensis]RQY78987.1 DUF3717 domain-containing protein [Burkholderia stagnalis]RQZ04853.1 DUF3717 domain-containing protein [Burkholderia stagnalis]